MGVLHKLWTTAPRDVALALRRRLRGGSAARDELLASAKHMRPQRFQDFLARFEAILGRTGQWSPLKFDGARVLEIGCGPLLGFGPLAIFRGCQSFVAVEPDFDSGILADPRVRDTYLLPVHKDLAGIYGELLSYPEFLNRLETRVTAVREPVHRTATEVGEFDIVLSNSCLEHLHPLADSIRRLSGLSAPGGRYVHLVDFGNHRATPSPFSGMYSTTPDEYFRQHGRGINLARAPDMLALFRGSGLDAHLQPYYWFRERYAERIHPHWAERYDEPDLFLKAALVYGTIATAAR